jgi:hypothetical protein
MVTFKDRLRHAWNVFTAKNPFSYKDLGESSSARRDIQRFTKANRQSIMSAALTKIAIDCAGIEIKHCRVDQNGRYKETIDSSLNDIFNLEANLDQTGRDFVQDIVTTMLDEGCVAIVPVETDNDLFANGAFGIVKMRTGRIKEWFPKNVRVDVYNELTGRHEDLILPKSKVGIIQNPLYAVMNEPNSTLQRLIRKLNLLDYIDEQSGSGKFNLIFQLPYTLRTEYHKNQAEDRRHQLENQLQDSKYGIGYIDATEKVTQLNRPIENNLLDQIKYLTDMFYSQIGMTKSVFDGTASETEMLNYYSRSIEPIMAAITGEIKRKFLTKTARSQDQSVLFFRNPFKLVPVDKLADTADRFIRNEILSPNEMRGIVGYKPVDDERADQLRNPNINEEAGMMEPPSTNSEGYPEEEYPEEEMPPESAPPPPKPSRRDIATQVIQNVLKTPMKDIVNH